VASYDTIRAVGSGVLTGKIERTTVKGTRGGIEVYEVIGLKSEKEKNYEILSEKHSLSIRAYLLKRGNNIVYRIFRQGSNLASRCRTDNPIVW